MPDLPRPSSLFRAMTLAFAPAATTPSIAPRA
jgi:hypothetical protein